MCGRFVSTTPPDQLAAYFGATSLGESLLEPSYNVAPTNDVHAILERDSERIVDRLRWGLVPSWAKDTKIGNRLINARCETVAAKNAFRRAFASSRCILPADGFYEWVKVEGHEKKTPMLIESVDGSPLAFAGLFETWRGGEDPGEALVSCTIITGPANPRVELVHDRMPVILPPSVWDEWLSSDNHDIESLQSILVPAPSELFTFHPVSTDVNNPRSRGEGLIEPVEVEGAPRPGDEVRP